MKTATVRDVQHHLSKILAWVEDGETIVITRYKKIVAKLVPAKSTPKKKLEWPDFQSRLKKIYGDKQIHDSASLLDEMREDRL